MSDGVLDIGKLPPKLLAEVLETGRPVPPELLLPPTVGEDAGEPLYLIEENPTAENIAMHIYLKARERGLAVSEVRLWETSTSCAAYSERDGRP